MSILFYCTFKNKDDWLKTIRKKFNKEKVYTLSQKPDFSKIKYAIIWNLPDKILKKLNNLKIIFSLGAGVDHIINLPSYKKTPILRIKDPKMAERMSNHVHSQILSYQLKLLLFHQAQNKKKWLGDQYSKHNSDITIGIMGFGYLGKSVGIYLKKLNYNVIGLKRDSKNINSKIPIYSHKDLDKFLCLSDIVISILPSTHDTINFINKKFLNKMKKKALLINIGRGSCLDEKDLLNHLENNKEFFASLDVFKKEPLPKNNKIWGHKNVTVTPHVAAITDINSSIKLMLERYNYYKKKNNKIKSDVNLNKGY